jgi:hypothetical protein
VRHCAVRIGRETGVSLEGRANNAGFRHPALLADAPRYDRCDIFIACGKRNTQKIDKAALRTRYSTGRQSLEPAPRNELGQDTREQRERLRGSGFVSISLPGLPQTRLAD